MVFRVSVIIAHWYFSFFFSSWDGGPKADRVGEIAEGS